MTSEEGLFIGTESHYDALIDEGNDPFFDPPALREHMDKWDGESFISALRLSRSMNVLEIGVGTGRLAAKAAPLCGNFTGIDLSDKTVKRARENLSGFGNVKIIHGDFIDYRFESNALFDVIYSSLTFMHIKDKAFAINKVFSLLLPRGRFVLSTDKNQSSVLEYGNRKLQLYPDFPNETLKIIKASGLTPESVFETNFAQIFTAIK